MKATLFPQSLWVYEPKMKGPSKKINEIIAGSRSWKFKITIKYDGVRTKGHQSEYLFSFDYKLSSLGIEEGFAN